MESRNKANLLVFLFLATTALHIVLLHFVKTVSATTQGVIASAIITLLVCASYRVVVRSTEKLNRWIKEWIIWSAKCRLVWFFVIFAVHLWVVYFSTPKRAVETGGALFLMALFSVVQTSREVSKATNDKRLITEYLAASDEKKQN